MKSREFILRVVRRLLKEVDVRIERERAINLPVIPIDNGCASQVESFLHAVQLNSEADRKYLQDHFSRLVRTFTLLPVSGGRILELGSYIYTAAVLDRVLGYSTVRGAYYSSVPGGDRKSLSIQGQIDFACEIDLFDAERHAFPYRDESFDVVLCCELIEHLVVDPMHLLIECHRVLAEDGLLLVTTPNVASFTSVIRTLVGSRNPQIFSAYPQRGNCDTPHVREYTAGELADAVIAAGFELQTVFTERVAGFEDGAWVKTLLEREGFDTSLRGEQIYCLARKRASVPVERYPKWLYAG